MSRILIIKLQPIMGNDIKNKACYYDSLDQELVKQGNEVLWLNTIQADYIDNVEKKKWINSWIEQIKKFNPDVIFTFNNQIFEEIIHVTNCPIFLFEADLPEFFAYKDYINKYKERYYAITFFSEYISRYKDLGFDENRIMVLHPATSVKSENLEKNSNIAFVGTNFTLNSASKNKIFNLDSNKLYLLLQEFWNTNNYNYEELCEKYFKQGSLSMFDCYSLFDSRVFILQSLLDLGLTLYGIGWDEKNSLQMLHLNSCFRKTPLYSLQQNQDLYNSSIINLSISHPQCRGYGFPWRVYDIMASSGILVSSYSSILKDFTKGLVDVPMYDSPYDARSLCKKILNEKSLREDIIEASNKYIEKHGRWLDNFEKLENNFGVRLISSDLEIGTSNYIDYQFYNPKKNKTKALKKSFYYGLLYAFTHIPIVYRFQSKQNRIKMYKSILKYNEELQDLKN